MINPKKYKESIFNYYFCYNKNKYIYNTLSESLAKITTGIDINNPSSESVKNGFVVDVDFDELQYLKQRKVAEIYNSQNIYFRIMTTSFCNAHCYYCYEKFANCKHMNEITAKKVADFIFEKSRDVKVITICWFGGEPLLNTKAIDIIMERLKTLMENSKLDITIESEIITNGSLITKTIADKMKNKWNISRAQISMDGTYDYYNKTKKYSNSTITFENILLNIELLIKNDINTRIRINTSKENIDEAKRLASILHSRFGNTPLLKAYPGFLFDGEEKFGSKFIENTNNQLREEVADFFNQCGYKCTLCSSRRTTSCYANRKNNFFITPNGDLYKCAQHYASNDKAFGHIDDDDLSFQNKWLVEDYEDKCKDCILLPLCQGGCIASKLTNLSLSKCSVSISDLNYRLKILINNLTAQKVK